MSLDIFALAIDAPNQGMGSRCETPDIFSELGVHGLRTA